jgi:hypothetical protein
MPLFFLIAIGAGALTLGAIAGDATGHFGSQNRQHTLQMEQGQPQQQVFATMADCQEAMERQRLPASSCHQR